MERYSRKNLKNIQTIIQRETGGVRLREEAVGRIRKIQTEEHRAGDGGPRLLQDGSRIIEKEACRSRHFAMKSYSLSALHFAYYYFYVIFLSWDRSGRR